MVGGLDPEVKEAIDCSGQATREIGRGNCRGVTAAIRITPWRPYYNHRHGGGERQILPDSMAFAYGPGGSRGADPIQPLQQKPRGAGFGAEVKAPHSYLALTS